MYLSKIWKESIHLFMRMEPPCDWITSHEAPPLKAPTAKTLPPWKPCYWLMSLCQPNPVSTPSPCPWHLCKCMTAVPAALRSPAQPTLPIQCPLGWGEGAKQRQICSGRECFTNSSLGKKNLSCIPEKLLFIISSEALHLHNSPKCKFSITIRISTEREAYKQPWKINLYQ